MALFDQDDIQLQLEATKMNQGGLQQLMASSAGGLALHFGFIVKAPFLEPLRVIGALVVLSWIVSLCSAVVAHRLHGKLFLTVYHLSAAARRVEELTDLPKQIEEQIKKAVDQRAVVARAEAQLEEERERFETTARAFEAAFFPIQERTVLYQ